MARRCDLTGVGVQSGNNVSHSKRRTRRRFLPNLQSVSLISDVLGVSISLRVTAATLRTVEHNGGLDTFLLKHAERNLTPVAVRLRRKIKKKLAGAEKAAA